MKKIIAFAGSNSANSINKQLVTYAVSQLKQSTYEILDLNDYPIPLYSPDLEKDEGYPQQALDFNEKISEADGIIVSLAEHNGSYSAVFKNLFDWLSRINVKTWQDKPILLMATSPGGRGGAGVLAAAEDRFPRHDGQITAIFSLPYFSQNFNEGAITESALNKELIEAIHKFESF